MTTTPNFETLILAIEDLITPLLSQDSTMEQATQIIQPPNKLQKTQPAPSDTAPPQNPAAALYTRVEMAEDTKSKSTTGCFKPIKMQECTVHRMLTKQHQKNEFLNSKEVDELIGLTRKFIPTKHQMRDYEQDIIRLGLNLQRAIHNLDISHGNATQIVADSNTCPSQGTPPVLSQGSEVLLPDHPTLGAATPSSSFVDYKHLRFPDERSTSDLNKLLKTELTGKAWGSDFEGEWTQYQAETVSLFRSRHPQPPTRVAGQPTGGSRTGPFNLTSQQRATARKLRDFDIIVCEADKNVGPVLTSRLLYVEQCKLTLEDKTTYEEQPWDKQTALQIGRRNLLTLINRLVEEIS